LFTVLPQELGLSRVVEPLVVQELVRVQVPVLASVAVRPLAWAAEQPRKPQLHVIAGAGHFFHGKLHELKPLVLAFLKS